MLQAVRNFLAWHLHTVNTGGRLQLLQGGRVRTGLRLLKPEAVRWLQWASQQGVSIAPRCLASCSRGELCEASAGRPYRVCRIVSAVPPIDE